MCRAMEAWQFDPEAIEYRPKRQSLHGWLHCSQLLGLAGGCAPMIWTQGPCLDSECRDQRTEVVKGLGQVYLAT